MKFLKFIFVFYVFIFSFKTTAQELSTLSSFTIPKELLENANAVVRSSETTLEIKAVDKLLVKEKRVVTVLNELGKKHIKAYQHYDNDTHIADLKVTVYDALGEKIKKYSKNDFEDVSAVDGGTLYSDSRVKYLDYTPTSYPFTIVFESEYSNSSTAFLPHWIPMETYTLSVEKSTFSFINSANIEYRKREESFDGYAIETSNQNNTLTYTLKNQPALKVEKQAPPFRDITPHLTLALNSFSLKGVQGKGSNWQEFGKWMYHSLYLNKNELNPKTIAEVNDLVKNLTSIREKAQKIYEYVQNKTRYVGVQIDIGGWEPIAANKVDEMGYGDCKGLTNYMNALLNAVGITSYHAIVYSGNKRNIDSDFTCMQGNHMILNIPDNENDLWLECTNQTMPFGFLGNFTDDRDVVVITPEGGLVKKTPSYKNSSLQNTTAQIKLDANGNITASLNRKSYGNQYNYRYGIKDYTQKELNKHYKSYEWDYNNNLELVNTKFTNNKDSVEFIEDIEVSITDYATISDANFLFRVNFFNKKTSIPDRYRTRKTALKIKQSFIDKDEYFIEIPVDYKLNGLPENKNISNKFGTYSISFEKINNNTLKYTRKHSINEGIYSKEDYKLYRQFIKTVAKYDNLRIELIK